MWGRNVRRLNSETNGVQWLFMWGTPVTSLDRSTLCNLSKWKRYILMKVHCIVREEITPWTTKGEFSKKSWGRRKIHKHGQLLHNTVTEEPNSGICIEASTFSTTDQIRSWSVAHGTREHRHEYDRHNRSKPDREKQQEGGQSIECQV